MEIEEDRTDSQSNERSGLLIAVALSLLLHGILIAALWNNKMGSQEESLPEFVQIRLFPTNPLTEVSPEPEPEPVREPPAEDLAEITDAVLEDLAVEAPPTQILAPVPENELGLDSSIELPELLVGPEQEITEQQEDSAESINRLLPSIVSVQNTLNLLESRAPQRYWLDECNPVEELESSKDCMAEDEIDFQSIQSNQTYRSLNPVRSLNRSQQTLGAIGRLSPSLSQSLSEASIADGLGTYLMEEVEAGITINSGVGNRQLQQINRMVDQSFAAKEAARTLGDAWVQQRSKELRQRKVVDY